MAAIAATAVAVAVRWHTEVDLDQQEALLVSVSRFDLRHAFTGTPQTSGPGFGLVLGLPFAVARTVVSQRDAYLGVSFLCVALLVPAVVVASRAVGVASQSTRELVNVAVVVISAPVLGAYWEAFHPVDVLAVALCLVAFAAFCRGHLGWCCVVLGVAVATRQWAVVVVAVLAAASEGRERAVVAGGALAVAAVLIAPFYLANPEVAGRTLAAKTVWRYPFTAPGLIPLGPAARYAVSRYLPLALVVLLCVWLYRRSGRRQPGAVVAALAAALLLRPLVDPAGFGYYLAASFPFLVLIRPSSWRWPVLATGLSVAVWGRRLLFDRFPAFDGLASSGWSPPDPGRLQPVGTALSIAVTVLVVALLAGAIAEVRRLTDPVGHGG